MYYQHDPRKLAWNVAKHGVWFQTAERFEWDSALVRVDDRHRYTEARLIAVGFIDDRLHVMVFTLRMNAIRIISLRRANQREVQRYAEA